MPASLRTAASLLLGASLLAFSPVATAAPVAPTIATPVATPELRALEHRTGLELGKDWRAYQSSRETRPFVDFVEARWRRQRDIGRGLTIGGASLVVVAGAMFFLALPRDDGQWAKTSSYFVLGASAGLIVAGSVLWTRNFRRLERLDASNPETAGLALGRHGRVRLRSLGPLPLPRGAGLGLRLAF